jgi:hypothetical protein
MVDYASITAAYPEAAHLVDMAERAWAGDTRPAKTIFPASDKLKAALKDILGKDIQEVFVTDSDVRHIKAEHGERQGLQGQEDITPQDFTLIPFVINEFDTVDYSKTDRQGNKKVLFTKRVDGLVFLVGIERGPAKEQVITLWKRKPGRVPNEAAPPSA